MKKTHSPSISSPLPLTPLSLSLSCLSFSSPPFSSITQTNPGPHFTPLYSGSTPSTTLLLQTSSLTTPIGRTGLNPLTLSDLDGGFVVDRRIPHPFLDLTRHGQKGLFDVGRVLGRGFEKGNAQTIGEFLTSPPHYHRYGWS